MPVPFLFELFAIAPWSSSINLLLLIALAVLVEFEEPGIPVIGILIITVISYFAYSELAGSVFEWVKENPGTILLYILAYVLIGIVYGPVRYFLKTYRLKKLLQKMRVEFDENIEKQTKNWNTTQAAWTNFYELRIPHELQKFIVFSSCKTAVITWGVYWPISIITTTLRCIFGDLMSWLYDTVFIGIFKKMYDKNVGSLVNLK